MSAIIAAEENVKRKDMRRFSESLIQRVKNSNGLGAANTLQNSKFDVFQAAEKASKGSSVLSPGSEKNL